ncbi:hypothetical protein ANN_11259 [Periplaneta americana]|uniref:Uncharacterized protein n=1 Tax=Periplaneta americana TaxID=6978 RepID=A0ABQ8T4I2_PERAM|nr:hypothetical protein ANN_11259 [Periplaneta americana]
MSGLCESGNEPPGLRGGFFTNERSTRTLPRIHKPTRIYSRVRQPRTLARQVSTERSKRHEAASLQVVNLLLSVAYKRACTGYSNVVDCCFRLRKTRRSFDMPLRRNRRVFTQLTKFERGRIVGMREAGWS